MDVLTAPERMRNPTTTTKPFSKSRGEGAIHLHGQAADEVVLVFRHPQVIGDHHDGQEADRSRQKQAVNENDKGRLLEVGQLGRLDFPVDLGQGFFAAHCQNRVPESDHHADNTDQAEPVRRVP